jgi:Transposase domain (DUF772)
LVERIEYDLSFRCFVGLGIEDAVWDATSFTNNRGRLLDGEVVCKFLTAVLSQDKIKRLLSSEHFSVDGMLLEARVSPKSFCSNDGSDKPSGPGRSSAHDFHGKSAPPNDPHASTIDPMPVRSAKDPAKRRGCASSATR